MKKSLHRSMKRAAVMVDSVLGVLPAAPPAACGAPAVAEILRTAPGIRIARTNGHEWAVASHGFNFDFAKRIRETVIPGDAGAEAGGYSTDEGLPSAKSRPVRERGRHRLLHVAGRGAGP